MHFYPKVGVVTVTYNSGRVILDFIRCMLKQDHPDYKLYVVDNASSDETLDQVRSEADGRVSLIEAGRNGGYGYGANIGIRAAIDDSCTHIVLINNDTLFEPDLLSRLVAAAELHGADMVTPKILFFKPIGIIWQAGGHFPVTHGYTGTHIGEGEVDRGQYDLPRSVDFGSACCLLLKREVFDRIGMFDERFFLYSEDADLCIRARQAGFSLWYAPGARVVHKVSSITGGPQSPVYAYHGTRSMALLLRKHNKRFAAAFWLCMYQIFMAWKLLKRDYSLRIYKIRQKAFFEAIRERST